MSLKKFERLSKTDDLYSIFHVQLLNNIDVHLHIFLKSNLYEDDYKLRETFFHSTLSIELDSDLNVHQ